jgi:hypothetical protein
VNEMLLNEFIKEYQKVQRLEAAPAAVNERLKERNSDPRQFGVVVNWLDRLARFCQSSESLNES